MTKPWGRRWRRSTREEDAERVREVAESAPGAAVAYTGWGRRGRGRVRAAPAGGQGGGQGGVPKSHRRKLEEADINRRATDLAFYLIRDHGDGAEAALAERLNQTGLTKSDRKRLRLTAVELAVRRKRDRAVG